MRWTKPAPLADAHPRVPTHSSIRRADQQAGPHKFAAIEGFGKCCNLSDRGDGGDSQDRVWPSVADQDLCRRPTWTRGARTAPRGQGRVSASWKQVLAWLATTDAKIGVERLPCQLGQLQANGPAGLSLSDNCSVDRIAIGRHVIDAQGDDITSAPWQPPTPLE